MKQIQNCTKIAIVGIPGCGKTFLAKILAKKLGLPLFHMDEHFLKIEDSEQRKAVIIKTTEEWTQGGKWIIDGNWPKHAIAAKIRLERADTVIHLDLPKNVCIESIKQRGKEQSWEQKDVDRMIYIVESYEQDKESLIRPYLEKYAKDKVIEFSSRKTVNEFIAALE